MTGIDEHALRGATARIEHPDERQGTGFLVAPRLLATAGHVVRGLEEGESLTVVFDALPEVTAEVRTGSVRRPDPDYDATLVELDQALPTSRPPLELVESCEPSTLWQALGYPVEIESDLPGRDGKTALLVGGWVQGTQGADPEQRPAYQLTCREAMASSAPLPGMSGSAVLSDAGVVGLLYRILPNGDSETGAYGTIYACPASVLLALHARFERDQGQLPPDLRLSTVEAASAPPDLLTEAIPPIPDSEFHAWVRGSGPLRTWTWDLVGRLEGYGFRVCLDSRPVPVDERGRQARAELLRICPARLAVGGPEAAGMPELDEIEELGEALAVWVDGGTPPTPFRLHQLVRFQDEPEGAALEDLAWAIVGQARPPGGSASGTLETVRRELDDACLGSLRRGARRGAAELLEAHDSVLQAGASRVSVTLFTANELLGMGEPARALEALDAGGGDGPRAVQLRALALARSDRAHEAVKLLEDLYATQETGLDPETTGILAGRYKRRWEDTDELRWAYRAEELYRQGWEAARDTYNGINVASLALRLGRPEEARDVASAVLEVLEETPRQRWDHWQAATEGEVRLLAGDLQEARAAYGRAAGAAGCRGRDIRVMHEGAAAALTALGEDPEALDDVFGLVKARE